MMKKYTKPSVEIVNLKSSDNIAASYKDYEKAFINQYINNGTNKYAVSSYLRKTSKPVVDPEVVSQ